MAATPRASDDHAPPRPVRTARDRIIVTAGTYTAKYRDGSGIVREVATGCRDESAARSVLTELEIASGSGMHSDDYRGCRNRPPGDAAASISTPTCSSWRLTGSRLSIGRMSAGRRPARRGLPAWTARRPGRESLERVGSWHKLRPAWARTRTYRAAAVAFCNWCVETGRLFGKPLRSCAES